MSEQEKYDELIRQKFAEKEFIFNEENWEKAEHALDLSKKSKKIFRWSSVFLIGLITGICITLLFDKGIDRLMNPTKDKSSEPNTIEQRLSSQKHNAKSKKQNKNLAVHLPSSETKEEIMSETDADEDVAPATNAPGTVNNTEEKSDQETYTTLKGNTKDVIAFNSQQNALEKKRKEKKATLFTKTFNNNTSQSAIKHSSKKEATAEKKAIKKGKHTTLLNSTQQLVSAGTAKNTTAAPTKKAGTTTNAKTSSLTKNNSKKTDLTGKKLIPVVSDSSELLNAEMKDTAELKEMDQKQLVVADSLSDSVKQEVKMLVADSLQSKADSSLAHNKALEPLPIDGLASITLVSIDAGANAQIGWQYANVVEGRGITPIGGVGITHYFNQKLSFYSGLQYNGIAYLKASSKTITTTSYGFGSTTMESVIKPGILSYLAIPLTFQYHFNDANAVFAGGNFAFLLNKKNKIELNYTSITPVPSTNSVSNLEQKTTTNYYAKAFNPFDAGVCVGYRRKLSSHFTMNAIATYGLVDIKKNDFFSQNKLERNSSLKLVLSYTIFDF